MPDLVALDGQSQEIWRKPLPDRPITLGRVPQKAEWALPEAKHISSLHATLHWHDGRLDVRRRVEPPTLNPIVVRGQPSDEFALTVGQSFQIGSTTFQL